MCSRKGTLQMADRWPAPPHMKRAENAGKCPKCRFQHGDPAVVGRKSGSPESVNDDFCMIVASLPQKTGGAAWFAERRRQAAGEG